MLEFALACGIVFSIFAAYGLLCFGYELLFRIGGSK